MKWPGLDSGECRHYITLLNPSSVVGIAGTETIYQPYFSTKAKIEFSKGTDLIKSGQDSMQMFTKISMRFAPGITSSTRVRGPNAIYTIRVIDNVLEMNRVLVLFCLAVGAQPEPLP